MTRCEENLHAFVILYSGLRSHFHSIMASADILFRIPTALLSFDISNNEDALEQSCTGAVSC